MLDDCLRLFRYYTVRLLRLPTKLWIDLCWAELKYRETRHLLRLDDYLLADMGLRRRGGRIEAIDASRIETRHEAFGRSAIGRRRTRRARQTG